MQSIKYPIDKFVFVGRQWLGGGDVTSYQKNSEVGLIGKREMELHPASSLWTTDLLVHKWGEPGKLTLFTTHQVQVVHIHLWVELGTGFLTTWIFRVVFLTLNLADAIIISVRLYRCKMKMHENYNAISTETLCILSTSKVSGPADSTKARAWTLENLSTQSPSFPLQFPDKQTQHHL